MRIQRTTTLLQTIADLRNWVIQNVPGMVSLAACDLFLKVGNDYLTGQTLDLSSIYHALPHSQESIRLEIHRMEQNGLIEQIDSENTDSQTIVPTERFIALLRDYQRKFESLFILRANLRQEQLLVASSNPHLANLAFSLYDHFYDLGWLYLYNYGSICFLMASLVKEVATLYGHNAQIKSGYVEITSPHAQYLLGAQGYVNPGQIEGHAFCVIDDALLIDFGLGNVRKGYRRNFYWALACDYQPNGNVLGQMILPSGETVAWKNDWQSPDSEGELQKYEPIVKQLSQHYLNYFG